MFNVWRKILTNKQEEVDLRRRSHMEPKLPSTQDVTRGLWGASTTPINSTIKSINALPFIVDQELRKKLE